MVAKPPPPTPRNQRPRGVLPAGEAYPAQVIVLARAASSDITSTADMLREEPVRWHPTIDRFGDIIDGLNALDRAVFAIPGMRQIRMFAEAVARLAPEHASDVADVLLSLDRMLRRACRLDAVP